MADKVSAPSLPSPVTSPQKPPAPNAHAEVGTSSVIEINTTWKGSFNGLTNTERVMSGEGRDVERRGKDQEVKYREQPQEDTSQEQGAEKGEDKEEASKPI